MKTNPYLQFNGNCEEALKFYEKALGGKIVMLMRYREAPPESGCSEESMNKIMHGRLIFDGNVLMASDCPPQYYKPQAGFSISVNVNSPAEAEKVFAALSEKANVMMPIGETFWAQRFGMLHDQFGVPWMVNCEKK